MKAKYDHEAAKKASAAKKAAKKTTKRTKKKSSASDMFELNDNSESEVALDSLGSFFNYLLTLIIVWMTRGPAKQLKKR